MFTQEYFDALNRTNEEYPVFKDIDGKFYYFDTAKGGAWGYAPDEYPDTYELVSKTEDEICFNVIGYFKSSHVSPIYTVDAQTYSVTLTKTDDGWRFSHFSDPLHGMYDSRESTVFSSYFGKSSIDELMELDITYNGEKTTLSAWVERTNYRPIKYSVIDLDGDGEHEMVFWLAYYTNEGIGFLVLHDDVETVYAHMMYYRSFNELKADGAFNFSGGAANSGIGKLEFSGGTYTIHESARSKSEDNQTVFYYIENQEVSKAEFDAYMTEFNGKNAATWYEIEIGGAIDSENDSSQQYTVENTDGSVIYLYDGTNKLTAIPAADGLIDFGNIPKNIFDEYYGATGGDFEITVGGAVLSVHQYDSRYYDSVELYLNSITYSGRTVTVSAHTALSGNIGIVAFEADGAFVFMRQYYGDGEGYIIKDGAVYKIGNNSSPAFYDVSGVLSLSKGEDGEIMYKRIAEKFNTAAQSDYIILMNLTSRDQYYCEEGVVTVTGGELSFRRTELYTVSDYFEARGTTIDEWFENFDRSEFDKIFTGVEDPKDVTLEDVFEHNLSGQSDNRAAVAKEHFDAVLAGDEKVYLWDGKSELLALCRDYSGLVYEYPNNKIAYIDFDSDGIDELVVRSMGEHILQYDFEEERVYAVFISPRSSYIYFANGEIAYSSADDAPRYVVTKLSKGDIELSEVRYTETEPDREKPVWTPVDLPDLADEDS